MKQCSSNNSSTCLMKRLWPTAFTFCFLFLHVESIKNLGNWMALGMQGGSLLQQSDLLLLGSTSPLCNQITGLTMGQRKLCMLYTDHMMHVGRGARTGISECQFQFRHNKWNCSTVDDTTVLGPVLNIPSKEAAFANAIASAGVVYSISRGCRDGQLSSCGCSDASRPNELKKEWIWGGCGDNINYGYKYQKNFIDIREREVNHERGGDDHARQLMNLHNNEAGRRAVIRNMKVTCKCHGVSGSCSLITCWQQLSPFRKVGDYLQDKYKIATKVRSTRQGRLKVRKRSGIIPTANDLIFIDQSPNYCHPNSTTGSLGTQSRRCNKNSKGPDGCQQMCCRRGYTTLRTRIKERCKCKFHWCCYVECESCFKRVELTVCK
ncbi:protein Wnt-5b [Lepeophtheirus salmonis]|uniref:protein Wnt-5b n=1 Tax=Lepeophtheirus salmonis TaxID=72036 RepID=UPI001AE9C154|nr:protein Wnt-5b-like [Lepeophtheirus salmonis]